MYHYGGNNPIKYTDPTGEAIETAWDLFSLGTGVTSFIDNVKEGNIGGAFLDGVGIVVDAAAVILPGIPGGVGTLIKGTKATEIIQSTEKVNDVGINQLYPVIVLSAELWIALVAEGKKTEFYTSGRERLHFTII